MAYFLYMSILHPNIFIKDAKEANSFLFKDFIYLFLERGEGREKERKETLMWEKLQLVASRTRPNRGQTHNPGMCPNWELNQRPFTLWHDAQPPKHTGQGKRPLLYFSKAFRVKHLKVNIEI